MSSRRALKILFLLTILFLFTGSFVRLYRVSDISMNDTLMEGDLVWVENLTAGAHVPSWGFYIDRHLWNREKGIHRGDLLAFRHPLDRRLYLKRCVALPGDRVMQIHKNFYLQIGADSAKTAAFASRYHLPVARIKGAVWLQNPYSHFYNVRHHPSVVGPRELIDYPPTLIPPHRYFLMGDYRDNSTDSRFFGPVPYDYIYYRVFWVWQRPRPLEEMASVPHFDPDHPNVIRKKY
jgi:signal peptidase I